MAIRSSVTVCLVPEARGGPFIYWDDLAAACGKARALGFDAVEVFASSASSLDVGSVRALLADHGLALSAMGTGAGWLKQRLHLCLPDPQARSRALDFLKAMIDLAGALGAPVILGSMQGRSSEEVSRDRATGYLAEALETLGEHAGQYHVPVLYEPLNRYETDLVNRLAEGVNLLGALSTRNVRLLADFFHMNIEEQDLTTALRNAGTTLGHVHFVDSNRRPAGMGHLDLSRIASVLRELGYDGYASAEAFPYPDPDQAAAMTIESFRRFFHERS
ncbi:MAG: sugar phosphate isomerase/epimerase [Isosphaeraceae bacterium]